MQRFPWTLAIAFVGLLLFAPTAVAQAPEDDGGLEATLEALVKELAELRRGQQAIRQELQKIRQEVARSVKPAPPSRPQPDLSKVSLPFEGEPAKGDAETRLVLMEFFDYQ